MDLDQAQQIARNLLHQHGLSKWRCGLDNARQRCGACHYASREITLSRHFVNMNDELEVEQTILHEIAHALAGPNSAHGRQWQQIARKIGAPVEVTNATANMPEPGWHLRCLACARIVAKRHRRTLSLEHVRCAHCGVQRGELEWRTA